MIHIAQLRKQTDLIQYKVSSGFHTKNYFFKLNFAKVGIISFKLVCKIKVLKNNELVGQFVFAILRQNEKAKVGRRCCVFFSIV